MYCIVWPEYFEIICVAWHLIQLYCHSYRCLFYDLRAVIGRKKIYRCKDRNNLIDKYERQIITIDFIYNVHRFCVNWRLYCVKCKTVIYAICSDADFGKLCAGIVFVNVLIFLISADCQRTQTATIAPLVYRQCKTVIIDTCIKTKNDI